ncbi:MAG: hypothetical protein U5L45_21385 [Saprospiraceae bacterium]|nr:hypothetical protein [Saprospiraceae bacterium]
MKPYINSKYALNGIFALASLAQKEEGGSFFGLCPKNEPHSPPRASEASARTSSLDFMYGFKIKTNSFDD